MKKKSVDDSIELDDGRKIGYDYMCSVDVSDQCACLFFVSFNISYRFSFVKSTEKFMF